MPGRTMNCSKLVFAILSVSLIEIFTVQGEIFHHHRKIEAECGQKHEISWSDILEFRKSPKQASEKMLCYLKCRQHKIGYLDEFGVMNKKRVDSRIDTTPFLSRTQKNELRHCLHHIGAIKTCGDMRRVIECNLEVKGFLHEIAPKFQEHQIECGQDLDLTWADMLGFYGDRKHPSGKIMCYVKCFFEKEDKIDSHGNMNLKVVNEEIDAYRFLSDFQKDEFKICVRNIPKIKHCNDTRAIIECYDEHRNHIHRNHEECMKEIENSTHLRKNSKTDAEDDLCLLRCIYRRNGLIDENGELNFDNIYDDIDKKKHFTARRKDEIKTCLREVPPIKNCEYMKYIRKCYFRKQNTEQ